MMAAANSRSKYTRVVEEAIRDTANLPPGKFYVLVRGVRAVGSPPSHLAADVLIRFLPDGAPFCCGEPGCYSRVFQEGGTEELAESVRRRLKLRQPLTIRLNCDVQYFEGIEFTAFQSRAD